MSVTAQKTDSCKSVTVRPAWIKPKKYSAISASTPVLLNVSSNTANVFCANNKNVLNSMLQIYLCHRNVFLQR